MSPTIVSTGTITVDVVDVAPAVRRALGQAGQHVAAQVARLADRVDVDAVGDLARHAQHPRIDRGDVDLRVGRRRSVPGLHCRLRNVSS